MSLPLGARLSNPGNIRIGTKWRGLAENQLDMEFCTFVSMPFGVRALAKIIITYLNEKIPVNTITLIISRWAPPEDHNDTAAYIKAVSARTGIDPDATITRQDFPALIKAIIHQEQGIDCCTDLEISNGIQMAAGVAA